VLQLSLVLWGLGAATIGWYWAGVSEGRTSWVPLAGTGIVLAGVAVFAAGDTPVAVWAFAAIAAAGAGLAAAETGWGVVSDRTFGFFSLAAAGAYALSAATWAKAGGGGADHFDILALGLVLAAVGASLAFIAATLVPPSMIFRRVLGWMLVLAGFGVGFIGYAPSLNVNF
jgi:hypothetical protein